MTVQPLMWEDTAGGQLVGLPRIEVDMEVFGDPQAWHWAIELGCL